MLVRIMDRARKLVSVEEQEEQIAPIFKTDQNGNLDIIYSAEIKRMSPSPIFRLSDILFVSSVDSVLVNEIISMIFQIYLS